jgi:hypothetical protein
MLMVHFYVKANRQRAACFLMRWKIDISVVQSARDGLPPKRAHLTSPAMS